MFCKMNDEFKCSYYFIGFYGNPVTSLRSQSWELLCELAIIELIHGYALEILMSCFTHGKRKVGRTEAPLKWKQFSRLYKKWVFRIWAFMGH